MAFLKVLNVGQGDSMVIRPERMCKYSGHLFYVDVGGGSVDVTKEIKSDEKIHLILTHSHRDHINGIKYFFNNFGQIQDITVPFCFNEIALIARAILNLKGIKSVTNCDGYIDSLTDVTENQTFLKAVQGKHWENLKIIFAQEGDTLCDHFLFLNPPLNKKRTLDAIPDEIISDLFYGIFEKEFADSMVHYVNAVKRGYGVDHALQRYFVYENFQRDESYESYERVIEQTRAGCELVVNYFLNDRELFIDFNSAPNKTKMTKIFNKYENQAHDACIVLKAVRCDRSYLLTGDASRNVFNRLIGEGRDISACYLKVPHHGSRNNLNMTILNKIAPETAIISHGNKRFGRARDPHPNKSVLDMLEKKGIDIFVTNDVKKNDAVYLYKRKYADGYLEIE